MPDQHAFWRSTSVSGTIFQLQLVEIYGKIEFSLYIQQSQTDKLLILVLPPTVSPISECVALQCGGAERAVLSISSHSLEHITPRVKRLIRNRKYARLYWEHFDYINKSLSFH